MEQKQKNIRDLPQRGPLDSVPFFVTREKAVELLGGAIARGTLANLDSAGLGPDERLIIGGKAAYTRESFKRWVKARTGYDPF